MAEPTLSAATPEAKVNVRIPGIGIVRFPASMTDAEIAARRDELILEGQNRGPFGRALGAATEMVGKSILPTLGGIGGGLLAGPPGVVGGSMLMEGANQALGITESSPQDIVMAGAIPGAMGPAGKLLGAGVRRLPGARGILHGMAAEELAMKPGMLAPTIPSKALYARVAQYNPQIKATQLRATAEKLARSEEALSGGLPYSDVRQVARGLVDLIDQNNGELPFQVMKAELQRVGDLVGATASTGGQRHGAYKDLFRTGHEDFEWAAVRGNPALPAVTALKEANAARKMEFVVDDLAELFSIKGGGLSPRPDGAGVAVNFGTIIKKIEKDETIKKTLGDAPYKAMMDDLYRMWKTTPNLPAVPGQDAGSKNLNRSVFGLAGIGTTVGGYFYGPPGAAVLGGAGMATAAYGPPILGALVATKYGRSILENMLKGNRGVLSVEGLQVLGTMVGTSEPGRAVTGAAVDFGKGLVP